VYGFVEGNIRASGRVELRESALVKGDIVAGRLSIEENATIKGRVELVEPAVSAPAPHPSEVDGPLLAAAVASQA
jgi:cytoskeletal protein CcmA (bactofilin family)